MGLKLDRPLLACELAQGRRVLDPVKLLGARKNGARTDYATWQAIYSWSERTPAEAFGTVGRLFERPDGETVDQIQRELLAIEDERRAAIEEFKRRKEAVLARMTEIPTSRYSEIEDYISRKNGEAPE